MPGGNGTGPAGAGAMTGRGAGWCAGYAVPGYANAAVNRGYGGYGYGFSGGRGCGGWGRRNRLHAAGPAAWQYEAHGFGAPLADPSVASNAAATREQQADMLRRQSEYLEGQLNGVKNRLKDLEERQ